MIPGDKDNAFGRNPACNSRPLQAGLSTHESLVGLIRGAISLGRAHGTENLTLPQLNLMCAIERIDALP